MTVDKPVNTMIKALHSMQFNAQDIRMQLGIFENAFEKWLIQTHLLAAHEIDLDTAPRMAADIAWMIPITSRATGPTVIDITESKAYRRIMELFEGQAIGSTLSQ